MNDDRPARTAVYSDLMWPDWNPRSESYGIGDVTKANAMLDALDAEALAPVLQIINDTVIEANDSGGIDLNDLVTRLERAGYPLPDADDTDKAERNASR
jgi:hypothetical protein